MTIRHAQKAAQSIAAYCSTRFPPGHAEPVHDALDAPWFAEKVQRAIDAAISDLVRQGMGEAPVSEGEVEGIRKDHENYGRVTGVIATRDLLALVDFLQARIAFLVSDNESWQDGYQRGLEDGKRRLAEESRSLERAEMTPGTCYCPAGCETPEGLRMPALVIINGVCYCGVCFTLRRQRVEMVDLASVLCVNPILSRRGGSGTQQESGGQGVSDRDALMRAILEESDSDLNRLAFADLLLEQGEDAKAEFIRVQLELARAPECLFAINGGRQPNIECDYCRLLRRSEELLSRAPGPMALFCWQVSVGPMPVNWTQSTVPYVYYRRGFVESIVCDWAWWEQHHVEVLACQPVRRVYLTTLPRELGTAVFGGIEPWLRLMWPQLEFVTTHDHP